MSEKTTNFRLLVSILLLAFLFFNITYLPAFINPTGQGDVAQTGKTDVGSSISFIMRGGLDCLEAENVSFRIGSNQTFLARKLVVERYDSILSAVSSSSCIILPALLLSNLILGQLNPLKIVSFLHLKDGMI